MKALWNLLQSCALALACGVSGCLRAQGAPVRIEIESRWENQPLRIGESHRVASTSSTQTVDRLDYLLSNLTFVDSQGRAVRLTNQFAFISLGQGRTGLDVTNLPVGDYRSLRMDVGLPPEINHGDPTLRGPEDALNPLVNGLHWSWQGGYVFVAIEGNIHTPENTDIGYSYHLATDAMRQTFEIPIALNSAQEQTLRLAFQVDRLFSGRHQILIGPETASTHSRTNDPLAARLKDNLAECWRVVESSSTGVQQPKSPTAPHIEMASNAVPYRFRMPRTFPQPALPLDNPLTVQGVALGEALFNEQALSGLGHQSCASCHMSGAGFTDAGRRVSTGAEGVEGTRNSMPLVNLAWQTNFFWDGRARSLRQQVQMPIQSPSEMHASLETAASHLTATGYGPRFAAAFGTTTITGDRIARALEQYLLTLVSGNSRFDRIQAGLERPSPEEVRGFQLFFTEYDPRHEQFGADCFHCHGGALFSDFGFHNNGLDSANEVVDVGRSAITGRKSDRGKFKTPSLRNVAVTGPYMHDGRFATLEEVVAHYVQGVQRSETLDPNIAKHPGNGVPLSPDDQRALIAFLKSLTDTDLR